MKSFVDIEIDGFDIGDRPPSLFADMKGEVSGEVLCYSVHNNIIAINQGWEAFIYQISDIAKGREIAHMVFDQSILSMNFSRCGTLAIVSFYSTNFEIHSLVGEKYKRGFLKSVYGTGIPVFSHDPSIIISMMMDGIGIIKIWDWETAQCRATIGCGDHISALVPLPGGQEILVGTHKGELITVGMDGMNMRKVQIEEDPVVNTGNENHAIETGLAIMVRRYGASFLECTGDAVVVGLQSGGLQLRLIANLDHVVWSCQVYNRSIIHCCVSPTKAEIVTVSDEEAPVIISLVTGKINKVLADCTMRVCKALFTPDGSKMVTNYATYRHKVRTYDLFPKSRKRLSSFIHPVDPEKLLYHGEDVVTELYYRLKRNLFASVEEE